MKKKINSHLFIISILTMLLTLVSIVSVCYGVFVNRVRVDLKVHAEILEATGFFDDTSRQLNDLDLSDMKQELRITWIASDGKVLYDNDINAENMKNHADRPEFIEAKAKGSATITRRSETLDMSTFYYAILLENGSVLRVSTNAKNAVFVLLSAMPFIIVVEILIMLLSLFVSHILTRQLVRPIEVMAQHIEDNSLTPPYRELVPFANALRKQHADILAGAKMRQDFTANVSHELKTPLTAIHGYAELIKNHMCTEEQCDKFAGEIINNSDRLLTLINDTIQLSALDSGGRNQISMEEVELSSIVKGVVNDMKVPAEKRNIKVAYGFEEMCVIGNKDMLREVAENLITNAVRYNNDGGHVWVYVGFKDNKKVLSVRDDGIGIPKEDQERIFERFYRVDKGRSRATGGTGLGLAIVKHILDLHEAKISLDSDIGKGTEITVSFR